jgi:hypothetical protein
MNNPLFAFLGLIAIHQYLRFSDDLDDDRPVSPHSYEDGTTFADNYNRAKVAAATLGGGIPAPTTDRTPP